MIGVRQISVREKVPAISNAVLHRQCACGGECEECRRESLERKPSGKAPSRVPPIVHEVLRSPGRPLDSATRAVMEPRFGHDFSRVRVHADANAGASAGAVNAKAFAVANHIVFNSGEYLPHTVEGLGSLAHELAHVVQQAGDGAATVPDQIRIGSSEDRAEREA